jgi:hypothetical protein
MDENGAFEYEDVKDDPDLCPSMFTMSDLAQIQGSTWEGRCPNCQGKGHRIEGINRSVLMWFHWCPGLSLDEGPVQWQETEEQLNEEYREND